jgi:hypothetical protein
MAPFSPHPKRKHKARPRRIIDERFLRLLRMCQCVACGSDVGCDASHIRYSDALRGKVNPGIGRKPDDRHALPQCRRCHEAQHAFGDEYTYWQQHRINPIDLSEAIYSAYLNKKSAGASEAETIDLMRLMIRRARLSRNAGI